MCFKAFQKDFEEIAGSFKGLWKLSKKFQGVLRNLRGFGFRKLEGISGNI